jgi:hypothetical protein
MVQREHNIYWLQDFYNQKLPVRLTWKPPPALRQYCAPFRLIYLISDLFSPGDFSFRWLLLSQATKQIFDLLHPDEIAAISR